MNLLTQLGLNAAHAGDSAQARRLLGAAVEMDEGDVTAWWWLSRTMNDPKARHKCLEKAQAAAAQSEEGSQIYKNLLAEAGAPRLRSLLTVEKSKSIGDQCPICSEKISLSEEIVLCPTCHHANHRECWEGNVFHCGVYACDGSALVDDLHAPQPEGAVTIETVQLDSSEIPETTPWATRETKEAGFVNRLKQQAFEAMAENAVRQMLAEGIRQQRVEQFKKELSKRQNRGLAVGFFLGIFLCVPLWELSHSWWVSVFTILLTTLGASTAAARHFTSNDPIVSTLYWLLPHSVAIVVMPMAFQAIENGFLSTIIGIVAFLVSAASLKAKSIYERRTFVAFSSWSLIGLSVARFFINRP